MPFGGAWFLIRIWRDSVPKNSRKYVICENFGAGDRIRTGDIDLGKVALYQLSYSRVGRRQDPLSRPKRALSNSFQMGLNAVFMKCSMFY